MSRFRDFWDTNKNTIKNITIAVTLPISIIALSGIKVSMPDIDGDDFDGLFDGDNEEIIKEEKA